MKRQTLLGIGILAVVLFSASTAVQVVTSHAGTAKPDLKLLQFDSMIGNAPGQTINGINADDLPWYVNNATGSVTVHGLVDVNIQGLVFANKNPVPKNLRGKNDEPYFWAVVSCLTLDENGNLIVANVETNYFPATTKGNCHIHDHVTLPNPMIAPMVFIVGPNGTWFAVNGW